MPRNTGEKPTSTPVKMHDRRVVAGEPLDRVLEARRDLVGVGAGPDDVVAARRDRDEVGAQRERRLELLVDDLLDELAAHREVRVREVLGALREHLRDAIGPAAVAARHGRLGVADALRERIAEGDVAGPGMLLRDHALHCAKPPGSRMSGPSATLESSEHRDPLRPPAGHLGRRTPLPVVPRAGRLGHRQQAARLAGRSPRAVPRRACRATSSPPRRPAPARPPSPCASRPNCAPAASSTASPSSRPPTT